MSKFALKESDIRELGKLYNTIASGAVRKAEKVLDRHIVTCYDLPNFDKDTIRIDVRSISRGGQHD